MKLKLSLVLTGFLAVWTLSTLSFAAKPAAPETTPACKAETERFCKNVKPGEGRVIKCLEENKANITVACKESLDEAIEVRELHAKVKNFRTTCKADLETTCAGAPKGQGRQIKCLKANTEKLTAPCKTLLTSEGFLNETAKMAPEAPVAPAAPVAAAAAPATTTNPAPTTNAPAGTTVPAAPPAK